MYNSKISQISSIDKDISLLFIRCKIYIELERYDMAFQDFFELFRKNNDNISFISLLQKYLTFWKYLCDYCGIKTDLIDLGIFKMFNIYMYKGMKFLILLFS